MGYNILPYVAGIVRKLTFGITTTRDQYVLSSAVLNGCNYEPLVWAHYILRSLDTYPIVYEALEANEGNKLGPSLGAHGPWLSGTLELTTVLMQMSTPPGISFRKPAMEYWACCDKLQVWGKHVYWIILTG